MMFRKLKQCKGCESDNFDVEDGYCDLCWRKRNTFLNSETCELTYAEWPIAFGLSIQQFIRRAEIEELARSIRVHAHNREIALCDNEDDVYEYSVNEFRTALDRLASIALGSN